MVAQFTESLSHRGSYFVNCLRNSHTLSEKIIDLFS